jgi:hypothetical protein
VLTFVKTSTSENDINEAIEIIIKIQMANFLQILIINKNNEPKNTDITMDIIIIDQDYFIFAIPYYNRSKFKAGRIFF